MCRISNMPKRPYIVVERPDQVSYEQGACLLPELSVIGWARVARANRSLEEHQHPCFELHYLEKGHVTFRVAEDTYELRRGDAFLTQPRVRHAGLNEILQPCEVRWLQFRVPRRLPGFDDSSLRRLRQKLSAVETPLFTGTSTLKESLKRVLDEHRQPSSYSRQLLRGYLQQLIISVLRAYEDEEQADRAHSEPVTKALTWLSANLAKPAKVADLANLANLSVSQFHKQFLHETGFSPAEYRTRERLKAALRLLKETDQSITDIAFGLGFGSSQYFATVFKKYQGLSPSAYREHS